jgi:hypothetical protein
VPFQEESLVLSKLLEVCTTDYSSHIVIMYEGNDRKLESTGEESLSQ